MLKETRKALENWGWCRATNHWWERLGPIQRGKNGGYEVILRCHNGLLSLKEAAETYHVPFYTLQSAAKRTIEPVGRVGLAYYYQPKTVENFLKEKQLI